MLKVDDDFYIAKETNPIEDMLKKYGNDPKALSVVAEIQRLQKSEKFEKEINARVASRYEFEDPETEITDLIKTPDSIMKGFYTALDLLTFYRKMINSAFHGYHAEKKEEIAKYLDTLTQSAIKRLENEADTETEFDAMFRQKGTLGHDGFDKIIVANARLRRSSLGTVMEEMQIKIDQKQAFIDNIDMAGLELEKSEMEAEYARLSAEFADYRRTGQLVPTFVLNPLYAPMKLEPSEQYQMQLQIIQANINSVFYIHRKACSDLKNMKEYFENIRLEYDELTEKVSKADACSLPDHHLDDLALGL